jgi:hypothetical protein
MHPNSPIKFDTADELANLAKVFPEYLDESTDEDEPYDDPEERSKDIICFSFCER